MRMEYVVGIHGIEDFGEPCGKETSGAADLQGSSPASIPSCSLSALQNPAITLLLDRRLVNPYFLLRVEKDRLIGKRLVHEPPQVRYMREPRDPSQQFSVDGFHGTIMGIGRRYLT